MICDWMIRRQPFSEKAVRLLTNSIPQYFNGGIFMTKLVDARTSQNASFANSIAIPILIANTPQLFGQVGLNTLGSGSNIRVQFNGTISLQLPLALVGITVTVVRGTTPTGPLVYSATSTYNLSMLAPQVISFTCADFNPPPVNDQLTYSVYVSSNLLGTIRVGPENFSATAYSD